jgi:glycine cleavage system H protein
LKPEQLRFAQTHEWVSLDKSSGATIATIGISSYAVEALNDLVFIQLPKVGRKVSAGESICEIESVKAVSDIYAPVSGDVVEVNSPLADNLDTLSSDAYDKGWLAKIKVTDDANLTKLMDYTAYQKMLSEESH